MNLEKVTAIQSISINMEVNPDLSQGPIVSAQLTDHIVNNGTTVATSGRSEFLVSRQITDELLGQLNLRFASLGLVITRVSTQEEEEGA